MKLGLFYSCALSALLLTFAGCSLSSKRTESAIVPKAIRDQDNVSIESVEEQAKLELQQTKTSFYVSHGDDRYAWERARLFFLNYLREERGQSVPITSVKGKTWSLSNSNYPTGHYQYVVQKTYSQQGLSYKVSCSPKKAGDNALNSELNAQNLARFINTGKIELTLLHR